MNLIPQGTTPSLRRCILAALMRIANRNGHPQWYAWKTRLLEHYAERDGFDTQRYEAPCWTCGGTGVDDYGECFDCNEGVHHVTRTVLTRYVIEGYVFHQLNRTRLYTDKDYVGAMAAKTKAEMWFARYGTSVTVKPKRIHCAWRLYVNIKGLIQPLESWPWQFDGYMCHVFVDDHPRRLQR